MSPPLLALLSTLLGADPSAVSLQRITFPLPRTATGAADERELNLLLSARPDVLSAALAARGFQPLSPDACAEGYALDGEAPALAFVADPTCEAGSRTELWLYPRKETPRRLPFFAAIAVERPCGHLAESCSQECFPASATPAAVEKVRAALAFGLSQERQGAWTTDWTRIPWLQLELPPPQALPPRPPEHDVVAAAPAVTPQVIETVAVPDQRVALTFDACSTFDNFRFDQQVIDTLEAQRVPATLFISGRWALSHPEELARLAKNPLFELGNHAFIHPRMEALPRERLRDELLFTQRVLFGFTGKVPRYFRPPFGEHTDALVDEAAKLGLVTVEYDVAAGDSQADVTPAQLTGWVLERARSGSVVVMHMNGKGVHTAASLPAIIAGLRAKGLTPSQVGQMVQATQVHTAKAVP